MNQASDAHERGRPVSRLNLILPAAFALCAVALGASSVVEGSAGLLHASRSAMILSFVGLRRVSAAALDASLTDASAHR